MVLIDPHIHQLAPKKEQDKIKGVDHDSLIHLSQLSH